MQVDSAPVRPSLREPILTFIAVIALASGLFWVSKVLPFVHRNLHAVIAIIFFYAPVVAGRLTRRSFDFRDAGLRVDPIATNIAVFVAAVAITFPLFMGGFFAFYDVVCGTGADTLTRSVRSLCPGGGWHATSGAGLWGRLQSLRLAEGFPLLAANQVLVIALPEEMFFRGYLQGRLEERWPPGRRLFGAPVGKALLASAGLFAVGHFLVDFNPQRLAVFFPALVFGWMRARTRSVAPGTAFHASCNLLSDVLHTSYF